MDCQRWREGEREVGLDYTSSRKGTCFDQFFFSHSYGFLSVFYKHVYLSLSLPYSGSLSLHVELDIYQLHLFSVFSLSPSKYYTCTGADPGFSNRGGRIFEIRADRYLNLPILTRSY